MSELKRYERETIHWRDTLTKGGNPFAYKPHPHMRLEGGMKVLRKFAPNGKSNYSPEDVQFFDVIYDEDYVVEYILRNVVTCFPAITHVEMRELFTKALKRRSEQQQERKGSAI